jgi:branched-chain amino acid transport system permease protein
LAAASAGINVARYKLLAFTVSSFYAGVAGGMYMGLNPDVDPRYFDALTGGIPLLIVLVIGGVTSIAGALLASYLYTLMPILLPQLTQRVLSLAHLRVTVHPSFTMVVLGLLALAALLWAPDGIVGEFDRRLRLRLARSTRSLAEPSTPFRSVTD